MRSYGVYETWKSRSKDLPQFIAPTNSVQAEIGVEFGFIVNIKGAKNQPLDFCIDHPGILDDRGNVRAPFDGTVYIKSNDWNFYLGDTIWEPVADKIGKWRMTLEMDGKKIADQTFNLYRNQGIE